MDNPNEQNKMDDEMLYHARRWLFFCELLIQQCDSWLSEEEGMKNMEKAIRARRKAERKEKRRRLKARILKLFGIKATDIPPIQYDNCK